MGRSPRISTGTHPTRVPAPVPRKNRRKIRAHAAIDPEYGISRSQRRTSCEMRAASSAASSEALGPRANPCGTLWVECNRSSAMRGPSSVVPSFHLHFFLFYLILSGRNRTTRYSYNYALHVTYCTVAQYAACSMRKGCSRSRILARDARAKVNYALVSALAGARRHRLRRQRRACQLSSNKRRRRCRPLGFEQIERGSSS